MREASSQKAKPYDYAFYDVLETTEMGNRSVTVRSREQEDWLQSATQGKQWVGGVTELYFGCSGRYMGLDSCQNSITGAGVIA